MLLQELQRKIEQRSAVLGVIGLGYLGLSTACTFAQVGFRVIGLDMEPDRVAAINAGRCPIEDNEPGLLDLLVEVIKVGRLSATTDYAALSAADIILIDVKTPVEHDHQPRYDDLKAVCSSLAPVIRPGVLVILESATVPGTVDNLVRPLLETSGRRVNVDFYLGMCPERVMPQRLLINLHTVGRVCGGATPETAQVMVALYRQITQAELDTADLLTAEMVKTVENAYRDVQIAFANEVALICEANGADVWHVRDLVNKSPYRQMHLPGAGVGGHCLPKDPWLLVCTAEDKVPVRLIPTARSVNQEMPLRVADMTVSALQKSGCLAVPVWVAVLGYAYLENSADTCDSPSRVLVARLRELGLEVVIHDPCVAEYQGDLLERVTGCDAVVVMVAHDTYCDLDLDALKQALRTPIMIDGRGIYDPVRMRSAGFMYRGIGRG